MFNRAKQDVINILWFRLDKGILFPIAILYTLGLILVISTSPYIATRLNLSDYHFKEGGKGKINIPDTEYCPGGGYFISKKSINVLLDNLLKNNTIFEDQSVGYCLNKQQIYPKKIKAKNNFCFW